MKSVPLEAAQRIHKKCEHFEKAWDGPARPRVGAFLGGAAEPERSWLLAELLSLEVELRRGAGEQPTEAEYRQSFPGEGDRHVIAAAFRRCADSQSEAKATPPRIEGYELHGVLGRGGMGVVYKARHLGLKRLVALKMILAGGHAGAEHLARFRTEAEMVARLQHPNIVQIFDIGEQDGHPYLAFEFIEGQTLADLAGREPQPPRVAAELLEVMARAVHYAHQQGIVHRDLKPANVLLAGSRESSDESPEPKPAAVPGPGLSSPDSRFVPKITDFGLAKDLAGNLEHTATGSILGTPLYMSPEQAEGRRDIGPASDIYSLGAILYALLIGRPPFQGPTPISTLKMVVSTEPVPPSDLLPHLARDLETICLKCLHKDPARRYETAGALADDLRRFLNDEPILARPSGRVEKAWRWCRRNPAVAALLASVLLVLVTGSVVSNYFAMTATREAQDARDERNRADASAQRARERAYGSDLRLVQRAWEDNLLILSLDLLDGQRPERTDNVDVRGLEWHYWRRQAATGAIFAHHSAPVTCVCFSPDGTRIASASHDSTVKVWDARTGQEKLAFKGHTLPVYSVCFSPDGKQIASGSVDRTVKVWDAETGREWSILKGHTASVLSVAFSPDGTRLVSCGGGVKVWVATTGEEKVTIKGHTSGVNCVCFNPAGTRIVSGNEDNTVKVWDAKTGDEKLTFRGHTSGVGNVSFRPDGKRILSVSRDGTTKAWDAETGQERLTFKAPGEFCAGFSPDGTRMVSGNADPKVWDAETGQAMFTLVGHTQMVNSVGFSPDGTRIVSGSSDATVRVWDARPASKPPAFEGHKSQVTYLATSPNGRWLASSGGDWNGAGYTAGELRLWDSRTGALLHNLGGHSSGVTCVAFSPDGRYLASGSGVWDEAKQRYQRGEVRLWGPASGALLQHLEGHGSGVLCVAFSPDSQFLASADFAGEVRVAEVARNRVATGGARPNSGDFGSKFTLSGLPRIVTALAFSPDGRFLAAGGQAGSDHASVKIWNLIERSEVASLSTTSPVSGIAFSPDSKQLAVATYSAYPQLYDTKTYKEVRRLQGHLASVTHVAYSPDGKRIATASEDKTVKLWDSASGQEMLTLKGHTDVVRCVKFSPDGQRLFSGGWDRNIRLWDATPRE